MLGLNPQPVNLMILIVPASRITALNHYCRAKHDLARVDAKTQRTTKLVKVRAPSIQHLLYSTFYRAPSTETVKYYSL